MTMERAMAIMTGAVERYDGWVASHTGDGFMGLFGLPTAHEDDPARAVSAAIEMVGCIDTFAAELRPAGSSSRSGWASTAARSWCATRPRAAPPGTRASTATR